MKAFSAVVSSVFGLIAVVLKSFVVVVTSGVIVVIRVRNRLGEFASKARLG